LASSALKTTTSAAPGPAASAAAVSGAATAAAEIVVVSTRDDFLLELGAVFASAGAVYPVESLDLALERISALRFATVLVLDTRGMANLRNGVGRAFARAPAAAVLLFANAADEEGLRRMFNGSKVSAVLPIPMDAARTGLAIAHALTDSGTKTPAAPPVQSAPVPAKESSAATPSRDRWGAGAAVAVLVLAAAWFIAQHKPAAVAKQADATSSAPATPATPSAASVDAASTPAAPVTAQNSSVSRPPPAATVQATTPNPNGGDASPAPQVRLKLIHYVAPDYPAAARARGVAGTVTVAYTVNTQGATSRVRVVSAEPAGIFNRDAVAAVKRWRYAPVIVADAAVAVPTHATIRFAPP
jgi:periplasmic protein TonB